MVLELTSAMCFGPLLYHIEKKNCPHANQFSRDSNSILIEKFMHSKLSDTAWSNINDES